jgi:outer membrane biosynthesis protein TonB
MTKDSHQFRDDVTDDGAGWINRFLAEEDEFDGRSMWRLASWGVGSVGALIIAILATRSPAAINRDQLASAEIARQTQQVQWIAKESQNKARELAAAVDTLNGDRDRLYARVTVLEQGLDSVTGALARPAATTLPALQPVASPPTAPAPAPSADADLIGPIKPAEAKAEQVAPPPKVAPVATVAPVASPPAKPSEQKAEAPPAEPAPTVTAAIAPSEPVATEAPSASTVRKTEFGVDLGGAKSIEGLRAVWRGALKVYSQQLASLQPVIVVKERHDGLGMQLRLVAGPLSDAAEAAKLCAGFLTESNRPCETAVYEGQRLSIISEKQPEAKKPEASVHRGKRRSKQRSEPVVEVRPKTSSFSSFFGNR